MQIAYLSLGRRRRVAAARALRQSARGTASSTRRGLLDFGVYVVVFWGEL